MSRKRTHVMGLICAMILISSCAGSVDSTEIDSSNVTLSNGTVCRTANQGGTITLACPSGQIISSVGFASYGTPSGSCGAFTAGTCNASRSVSVVSSACIGKSTCRVSANKSTFGDPCVGTAKRLYAQVTCAGATTGTGGAAGTGGATGTGTPGTGGATGTGVTTGNGGSTATGTGTPGTGGAIGTGGTTGTGSAATGTGTGLLAEYYNGTTFDTLALTRIDPTVDFDWGSGSAASSVNVDQFSARWTGQVQALYSETYTFSTQSDDGIRLWVNGQQLIEAWADYSPTQNSGTIALAAGQKYDLKVEYHENSGGAISKLSWSSSRQAQQIVPQSQLYPAAGGSTGTGGASGTGGMPGTAG
ncbi:MAG TPA: PA14 domain-containing protein, partial [Polyangia bacterium]|nr:PA14 domain-containing protein [Polyangia bacterium]